MDNHSEGRNRSEHSKVATLGTSETHSIDGNIPNYKSNGKMEPHGEITSSVNSQINKFGTVFQASEGFPLELLSNQNFNIEYEGKIKCLKNTYLKWWKVILVVVEL